MATGIVFSAEAGSLEERFPPFTAIEEIRVLNLETGEVELVARRAIGRDAKARGFKAEGDIRYVTDRKAQQLVRVDDRARHMQVLAGGPFPGDLPNRERERLRR